MRAELQRRAADVMRRVPILLAPTAPCVAPPQSDTEITIRGVTRPDRDVLLTCTVATTQFAAPVVSVPVGVHEGLPYGMQIVAPAHRDELAVEVAAACESL
jgi:Asp-tRNA(Asn)/Glu-tRNA(Gln) amidotransferase A subunit family amidase